MKLTIAVTAAIAFIFSEIVYAAPGKTESAFEHILEPRDNHCGSGVGSCGEGECCSESGYCGTSTEYCAGSQCQLDYSDSCDSQYVKIFDIKYRKLTRVNVELALREKALKASPEHMLVMFHMVGPNSITLLLIYKTPKFKTKLTSS